MPPADEQRRSDAFYRFLASIRAGPYIRGSFLMPTLEIFSFLFLGGLAWLWFDGFTARAAGIDAARMACESEGLQLLDDTVSIAKIRPARDGDGQLRLLRIYEFEYSDTGDNRRRGSVVLLGHRVMVVNIGLRLAGGEKMLH